tara:strand:+ start:317 stop:478 length:162 start_codon:yes stop_codon:yes gene_type:complete
MKNITVEEVLREAAIYREMVSVLLEKRHELEKLLEVYRRERYRKNRDDDNGNR